LCFSDYYVVVLFSIFYYLKDCSKISWITALVKHAYNNPDLTFKISIYKRSSWHLYTINTPPSFPLACKWKSILLGMFVSDAQYLCLFNDRKRLIRKNFNCTTHSEILRRLTHRWSTIIYNVTYVPCTCINCTYSMHMLRYM